METELLSLWPELLVNAVGVLLGGVGALAVARWRLQRQSAAERQRSREHLNASREWLRLESVENLGLVSELRRVLERGSSPRTDLLRWAGSIADALAFEAQSEIIRSGTHRRLEPQVERGILRAYQTTVTLRNLLRQAEPAVHFYVNCCGEEEAAVRLVAELHRQTDEAEVALKELRSLLGSPEA